MKTIFLTLIFTAVLGAATGAAADFRSGIYADTKRACAALAKASPPDGKPINYSDFFNDVAMMVDGSFMIVEKKEIGSVDFTCEVGKPRNKGKKTTWSLSCDGESSGGKVSTMTQTTKNTLTFAGGLKEWGEVYFCRG